MKKLCCLLLSACLLLPTTGFAQQQSPPPPAAPRPVTYPVPIERTLANGLRVIAVQRRKVPLVAAQLLIRSGSEADPEKLPGVAAMVAGLLTQGTRTRNALAIAQATDALGAELSADASFDASVVEVNATTPQFGRAFAIFSDVVRNPVFAPAEVERIRTRVLSELQLTYSDPRALARLVANKTLYGQAPYGHPVGGTPASVRAIDREALLKFHRTFYRPDNAVLVIGGDITPEAAFAEAERVFGNWRAPATALPNAATAAPLAQAGQVVVVDQPTAGRTAVVVGRVAIARSAADYFPAVVSNAVLSGYSGRLNSEIRIKRGLSYDARASLEARRQPGPFLASTLVEHSKAAEGARVLLDTVAGLIDNPPDDAELKPRKAVVTGGFARSLETIDGLVARVGSLALYNLPFDEINRFIPQAEAVTSEQIQQFASARLGRGLSLVLVGNARQFLPELRKQFPKLEVVPFDQLDLNQVSLSRSEKPVAKRR